MESMREWVRWGISIALFILALLAFWYSTLFLGIKQAFLLFSAILIIPTLITFHVFDMEVGYIGIIMLFLILIDLLMLNVEGVEGAMGLVIGVLIACVSLGISGIEGERHG